MKGRESGMPEEAYWSSFFDADGLVDRLVVTQVKQGDVVEFGTGYGTFTLPVVRKISGIVHGFDIEPELVDLVLERCNRLGLMNVQMETRDFVLDGTGLSDESVAHVMIYNLLHIEHPVEMLKEAFRILKPGGSVSVIHWRRDIPTPRGPSMDIRPGPEQCALWGRQAGFFKTETQDIAAVAPYHYGMIFYKPTNPEQQEEL